MIAFAQGKILGTGDLSLTVREETGVPYDPSSISYSIFSVDRDTEVQTLVTQPNQEPSRNGLGIYSIPLTIPALWNGTYRVVWYVTRTDSGPQATIYEDFQVVPFSPTSNSVEAMSVFLALKPGLTPKLAELVMNVRALLSDTNPDRNYHFRPPTATKTVAGYTSRVGFIWEDETIIRMLKMTVSQLNSWNPLNITSYNVESMPEPWSDAACVGAAAKCLTSEASRWISEEFEYSLNGISLSLNKSASYMSLASTYAEEFKAWAPMLTANRPASVGLRQSRWLI